MKRILSSIEENGVLKKRNDLASEILPTPFMQRVSYNYLEKKMTRFSYDLSYLFKNSLLTVKIVLLINFFQLSN
jgi:hypothetical protein